MTINFELRVRTCDCGHNAIMAQPGPVAPGQTVRVGEAGPELVTFGQGGTVTPASQVNHNNQRTVNLGGVYVNSRMDAAELVNWIRKG